MRRFLPILIGLVLVYAVYFAVQGGQYGTLSLWRQRQTKLGIQRSVDSITRRVDSLRRYRAQLDTDRTLQERLARENIGMVRGDKELLYWITPPDSGRKGVKKP